MKIDDVGIIRKRHNKIRDGRADVPDHNAANDEDPHVPDSDGNQQHNPHGDHGADKRRPHHADCRNGPSDPEEIDHRQCHGQLCP